ncbi:uncharacterized protein [Rutidosis leptorrhynchoides]|uniref:uncharacterized protein n=1 Tax=Rutidosis leptorrhynchoides TaxID=125765 RepID=UPI003A9960B8
MTLKDFFTLIELKDGLTNPSRVTDLLNVIQNTKETLKNVNEASGQWSAVANTIAATENKECLDLFIQLDGLKFINKWLNDAQNFVNDSENDGLEELIIALLRAIEKLHVDRHGSVNSGFGKSVNDLCSHRSFVVQEKAKALCDKWTPPCQAPGDEIECSSVDNEKNAEQTGDQKMTPVYSDDVHQETDKEEIPVQEIGMESDMDTIKAEKDEPKLENTPLTNDVPNDLEDAKEKREVNLLEHKTLTSSTDVDQALESEIMEDAIVKDEDMVDGGKSHSPGCQNTVTEVNTTSGTGDSSGGGLWETPGAMNPKTTSDTEDDEGDEAENNDVERSCLSNMMVNVRDGDLISNRPTDMELDCGMVDPLELARQVAIEVEQEIDSQDQTCSSTSTNENQQGGLGNEVSSGPEPKPETDIPAVQISETRQESGHNAEKGFSGFDLNQEFSSEETESVIDTVTTPISVVSASRPAAADGPRFAPLQFEGSLGWKGSAATSAFRPVPDTNSNQRLNLLEFDLNVAEVSEDIKMEDFLSREKVEEPPRLNLDLNSVGDGDVGPISLDWKRVRQNGPQSPCVSTSASSMHPSFRNIDLNLNNHFTSSNPNNASLKNSFLGKLFNNKRDEPVISIFGTQVEVNRKDIIPPFTQPNGRILEPSVDFSLGRPGSSLPLGSSMTYPNLPGYGYGPNGYAMGPMYAPPGAPIPYMVDTRGSPILPSMPPALSQQTQPLIFNMAGTSGPSGSNGAGTSRSNFDLNSGFLTEMGNRENNGGLRQFFNHNQASSSSVIGGKREEPESGWELFPINYKHQQPPWQ